MRLEDGGHPEFPGDPDKPWIRSELSDDDDADLFRVFDPVALLELLRSASRKTEYVGRDEVRGVAAEHFRLTVDAEKADVLVAEDERSETIPVDVWIGVDGLIRRMRTEDSVETATLEFFDFGAPVEIEAPPADQVGEIDEAVEDLEPVACPGGRASPLSEDAVKRALGEHGFDLSPMKYGCDRAGDVAVALTNILLDETDESGDAEADDASEAALVLCKLRHRPPAGAGSTLTKRADHGATTFALANLECSLYPQGEHPGEQLRMLERGLEALERTLR